MRQECIGADLDSATQQEGQLAMERVQGREGQAGTVRVPTCTWLLALRASTKPYPRSSSALDSSP